MWLVHMSWPGLDVHIAINRLSDTNKMYIENDLGSGNGTIAMYQVVPRWAFDSKLPTFMR